MADDLIELITRVVRAFPGKRGADRCALIDSLRRYDGDDVLKAMETLLHSGDAIDEEFQCYVMVAIVRFDVSRAAPLLLPFVNSPSNMLRHEPCGLLGDCADPIATTALLQRAQFDPDVDVRSLAIFSLGKIRDLSIIPLLEAIAAADDGIDSHSWPSLIR